jgi:UDP-3-O-[3-hydroxymyristoyl] N-acetylglucosamine deacetylase
VRDGDAVASLSPSEIFEVDFQIDFKDAAIGHQHKVLNMANGAFVRELSNCRTFCSQRDIAAMHASGMALGGNLNNAIVFDGDSILTPGGVRYADEAVRHKMLDAIGDLALAGTPLFGRYSGNRAGHALTNMLLRELFSRQDAFRMIICDHNAAQRLPGVGVSRVDIPVAA